LGNVVCKHFQYVSVTEREGEEFNLGLHTVLLCAPRVLLLVLIYGPSDLVVRESD